MIRFLVALLLLAAGDAGRVEESVTVHVVELEVAVSDLAGHPILDLGADDFHVFDDGEPVELEKVEAPVVAAAAVPTPAASTTVPTETAATAPTTARRRPLLVVVFHRRVDSLGRNESPFIDAARDLGDALARGDYDGYRVALASYQERLWIDADIHDDPRQLVKRARQLYRFDFRRPQLAGDRPMLARVLPARETLAAETSRFETGMIRLAEGLAELDEPARIHLFSPGWGALADPERGDPISPFRDLGVPVTVFDVSGADRHSSEARLAGLARQTGGTYYPSTQLSNQGRLDNALELDAARYRLVWRTRVPAGEHGWHKVRVVVDRPLTLVSARRGYSY